jgi:hypothetical protein
MSDLPPIVAHRDKAKMVRAYFVPLRIIEVVLDAPLSGISTCETERAG